MAEGGEHPTAAPEIGSAETAEAPTETHESGLQCSSNNSSPWQSSWYSGTHHLMIPGVNLAGVALAGAEMVIVQGGHGTVLGVTAMLMTQTRDGNTPGATPEPTLGQTALAILIMLLMGQGQGRAQVQMVKRKMQQLRTLLVEGTAPVLNLKIPQAPQLLPHKSQEAPLELHHL